MSGMVGGHAGEVMARAGSLLKVADSLRESKGTRGASTLHSLVPKGEGENSSPVRHEKGSAPACPPCDTPPEE